MSETTISADFEEALEKAIEYTSGNEILICIVHHIGENVSLDDLKFQVERCRADRVDSGRLEEYLQDLAGLGVIYAYLDGTYKLTRLGESVVAKVDKEKKFEHPPKA